MTDAIILASLVTFVLLVLALAVAVIVKRVREARHIRAENELRKQALMREFISQREARDERTRVPRVRAGMGGR